MSEVGSGAEPDVPGPPGLIVLVGGESTGKSALAGALAIALAAVEVPEALRDWVASHGRVPNPDEQRDVMAAQVARESEGLDLARSAGAHWVVSDGGAIMIGVYSLLYYRDDSLLPAALHLSRRAELIVWCDDDIAWVADEGQRDGPDARAAAQRILGEVLRPADLPWLKVSGNVAARVAAIMQTLSDRSQSG